MCTMLFTFCRRYIFDEMFLLALQMSDATPLHSFLLNCISVSFHGILRFSTFSSILFHQILLFAFLFTPLYLLEYTFPYLVYPRWFLQVYHSWQQWEDSWGV